MKAFIAGLVTLSLLICAVSVNSFLIVRRTDSLLKEIEALPDTAKEADCSRLSENWESSRAWIALTVHRKNVDDIDDTLAQLEMEIEEGNDLGYLSVRTQLLSIVERLKKTESFSLSRIF